MPHFWRSRDPTNLWQKSPLFVVFLYVDAYQGTILNDPPPPPPPPIRWSHGMRTIRKTSSGYTPQSQLVSVFCVVEKKRQKSAQNSSTHQFCGLFRVLQSHTGIHAAFLEVSSHVHISAGLLYSQGHHFWTITRLSLFCNSKVKKKKSAIEWTSTRRI